MSKKLNLIVNFMGVDKMSSALKNIVGLGRKGSASLGSLTKESRSLNTQLRKVRQELGSASGNVTELMNRERALERQIEDTNQAIEQQKSKLQQLARARGLKELGGKITGVGQSVSLYLTAPLVGAGFAASQMAKDFNAAMSDISTLIDTSTESIDLMGKQVRNLSTRVPVALEELPPALYDIRSAGIAASDSMAVLEGSAKLAVAGLSNTQESAGLVTSAINAFNLQGAEQQRIYDLLFKTVKNGKTTISGLAQGFGGVAGTIANANVEIDEYLASVAALTTTGLPAAQAHTQLRAVIAGLTRETGQSRAMFRRLGADGLKDLVQKSGGLVPALNRIKQELGGNDAEMLKLFGSTEALNAVLGLTGNQAEAFNKTLADMREGANAIDPAFAKQSETDAAKQIENMNAFRTAAIEAGNAILPVMTQVMNGVASLATSFSAMSPAGQKIVLAIAAIAAIAGPVLIAIGGMISIFGTLTAVAATLGVGVGALAGIVLGIPIAIAVVAGLVWYYWDEISGAFKAGWNYVKNLLGGAPDWLKSMGRAMMDGLLMAINPMALGKKLIEMASNGITAFKNYLGIKSPSRVFMALGQDTTEGLARGIDRGGRRPVAAMRGLAAGITSAGALALTPVAANAGAGGLASQTGANGGAGAAPVYNITLNLNRMDGETDQAFIDRMIAELKRYLEAQNRRSYGDGQ